MFTSIQKFIVPVLAVVILATVYTFNNPSVDFKKDTIEGIQFYRGTWNEVLQLARKENKPIFLDIYATWCGPCKKLKKSTFSNIEVGNYYNSHFINVTLDGEQGEGEILANQYRISGYPSLLFIDAGGKVIKQTSGFHNANELIALGKSVLP